MKTNFAILELKFYSGHRVFSLESYQGNEIDSNCPTPPPEGNPVNGLGE